MIDLSESQKKAVEQISGNLLVVAGAGSGKTRVITEKIKLTCDKLSKGEKILALAFSNKAANEMKERLENYIENLPDKVFIGTIHKFCLEILTSRSTLIGLPDNLQIFESQSDRLEILKDAINNVPDSISKYLSGSPKEVKKKISNLFDFFAKVKKGSVNTNNLRSNTIEMMILSEYDHLLLQLNAIDYDDILRYTYKLFNEREKVLRQYENIYKYVFVDEAQDMDRAQYNIISLISKKNQNLTLVGDSKQAIYSFNGASSDFFRDHFVNDFSPILVELRENFRSAKTIIKYAKKIKPSFNVFGTCAYDGEFEINSHYNDIDEANAIAEKIENLIISGHHDVEGIDIKYNQCLVLARNRYVFDALKEEFNKRKIEYTEKVSSQNSLGSESDFMYAIELLLKVIINPCDSFHLSKLNKFLNVNYSIEDYGSENDGTNNKILNFFKKIFKLFYSNDEDFCVEGLSKSIVEYIETIDMEESKLYVIYRDLDNWNKHWEYYIKHSYRDNRCLSDFLRQISIGNTSNRSEYGVVFSTVHMAKGLEYDVVFVMGVNEGVFPDYRSLNNSQKLNEEENNFFVAITRAKRLCYISYPGKITNKWGTFNKSRSRYIKKMVE